MIFVSPKLLIKTKTKIHVRLVTNSPRITVTPSPSKAAFAQKITVRPIIKKIIGLSLILLPKLGIKQRINNKTDKAIAGNGTSNENGASYEEMNIKHKKAKYIKIFSIFIWESGCRILTPRIAPTLFHFFYFRF